MADLAGTGALITLARAKTELSISVTDHDSYLGDLILEATQVIEDHLERSISYKASITEFFKGRDRRTYRVKNRPLVSITSLHLVDESGTETLLPSTDYKVDGDGSSGKVYKASGFTSGSPSLGLGLFKRRTQGHENYKIVYAGGYVTEQNKVDDASLTVNLPKSIERAVVSVVTSAFRRRGSDRNIRSRENLGAKISYFSSNEQQQLIDAVSSLQAYGPGIKLS